MNIPCSFLFKLIGGPFLSISHFAAKLAVLVGMPSLRSSAQRKAEALERSEESSYDVRALLSDLRGRLQNNESRLECHQEKIARLEHNLAASVPGTCDSS